MEKHSRSHAADAGLNVSISNNNDPLLLSETLPLSELNTGMSNDLLLPLGPTCMAKLKRLRDKSKFGKARFSARVFPVQK